MNRQVVDISAEELRARRRAELRNVIAMAVPVVITTSSRAMMDIVDYVMVTQLPTHDAQAAILPAQILMWSYIVIGLGIVSMVNTFASQSLGRGEPRECSAYGWQSLYLGLGLGLIGAFLIPLAPSLVRLIGHEPSVQAAEIAYLKIALLSIAPTIAAEGLGWYFVGIHRPWVAVWTSIEANVVNIAVVWTLMFGHFGFPAMGIAGAATGTVVAVCYRTVRLSIAMLLPSQAVEYGSRHTWRPSWFRIMNLLRVGVPCGIQWVTEVLVWAIFVNVLVGRFFGTAHLIATNTAWQYMRISFMPTIGIGRALSALVGRSIGEGDPQRAIRESRIVAIITLAYMGSLSLLYSLFGAWLIGLWNADPAVTSVGSGVMICMAVFQLFDALGITYGSALRGAGDTVVPSIFFIVSHWVIIVGGGWWVASAYPQWGSIGPWIAAATLITVCSLFLWWRWHSRAWMKIDIFRKDMTSAPATMPVAELPITNYQ